MIELFLERGARVDSSNHLGWTALHRTAYNGRFDACKMLIWRNASISDTTNEGDTPLHLACRMGHVPVMELLLQLKAIVDVPNKQGEMPSDLCASASLKAIVMAKGFGADNIEKAREQFKASLAKDAAGNGDHANSEALPMSLDPSEAAGVRFAAEKRGEEGAAEDKSAATEASRNRFKSAAMSLASFRRRATDTDVDGFPDGTPFYAFALFFKA